VEDPVSLSRIVSIAVLVTACFPVWIAAQEPSEAPAAESAPSVSGASDAAALIEQIEALRGEIDRLEPVLHETEGEVRMIYRRRTGNKKLELLDNVNALADNVAEREAAGEDAAGDRERVAGYLADMTDMLYTHAVEGSREVLAEAKDPTFLSAEERAQIERKVYVGSGHLTRIYQAMMDNVERLELLGLPSEKGRGFLTERLHERAENLATRMELAVEEAELLRKRLQQQPDDAELQGRLRGAQRRLEGSTEVLAATIDLMEQVGLETAFYQQTLIKATGIVTTDLLDAKVAVGLVEQWLSDLVTWVATHGPGLALRLLIVLGVLVAARFLARLVRRVVTRAVQTSKLQLSQLLQRMIINTATQAVWVLGLLIALAQLGISLGPLLAGLGIAGFIVGFALQDTLANFAAGMMILLYRPYDVGDLIEAGGGVFGKVDKMSLVSTTILTFDNQTLVLPNGKIWGDVIKNVTAQTQRRVDMTFGIAYHDDIPKAEKIFEGILAEHPKVLADPAPMVRLHNLGDSSVDFIVRPWVETDDYWDVFWDVTREVKLRLDREGISIPFPQRDVHFYSESGGMPD
jgi:small conductance mechanosensitive channel